MADPDSEKKSDPDPEKIPGSEKLPVIPYCRTELEPEPPNFSAPTTAPKRAAPDPQHF